MADLQAVKVVEILGIGSDEAEQNAFVEVVLNDGSTRAIAFDAQIANQMGLAFLAAGNNLLSKIAAREDPDSEVVPGQPIMISSARASLAQFEQERLTLLTLKTDQHIELLFAMKVRVADALAKRLQRKGTGRARLNQVNSD